MLYCVLHFLRVWNVLFNSRVIRNKFFLQLLKLFLPLFRSDIKSLHLVFDLVYALLQLFHNFLCYSSVASNNNLCFPIVCHIVLCVVCLCLSEWGFVSYVKTKHPSLPVTVVVLGSLLQTCSEALSLLRSRRSQQDSLQFVIAGGGAPS